MVNLIYYSWGDLPENETVAIERDEVMAEVLLSEIFDEEVFNI